MIMNEREIGRLSATAGRRTPIRWKRRIGRWPRIILPAGSVPPRWRSPLDVPQGSGIWNRSMGSHPQLTSPRASLIVRSFSLCYARGAAAQ